MRSEPNVRWVKMLPYGLAPRYDPSVDDSRHIAEGRVLILSAFPTNVPSSPISRANCLAMNDRIAALCQKASELGAKFRLKPGFGAELRILAGQRHR